MMQPIPKMLLFFSENCIVCGGCIPVQWGDRSAPICYVCQDLEVIRLALQNHPGDVSLRDAQPIRDMLATQYLARQRQVRQWRGQ